MEDQFLDENQVLDENGAIIGYYKYRNKVVDGGGIPVGFLVDSMEGVRFYKYRQHPDGTLDRDHEQHLFSGTTKFSYRNNGIYHGQYLQGLRVGIARFVFSQSPSVEARFRGAVYHGNFRRDYIMGHGTMTFPDGMKYEGNWVYGKEHGKGKVTWPDGRILEGTFVDGKIDKSVKGKMINVFGKTYTDFFDEKKLQEMYNEENAKNNAEDAGLGGNNSRMKRRQSKRQQSKRRQSKRQQSKRQQSKRQQSKRH